MAKKKIDMSGVKQFFIDKGEKVALVVCGLVAVILMTLGIMTGINAGKLDYKKDLEKSAADLQARISRAEYTPPVAPKLAIDWRFHNPNFQSTPWSPAPDSGDSKRQNPLILAVNDKQFQMDFIRGGAFHYQVDTKQKKIWTFKSGKGGNPGTGKLPKDFGTKEIPKSGGGDQNFAKSMLPVQMVVVSAVFPMKNQLVEYSKALRMSEAELLSKKLDLPKPIGINVWRAEVIPGKEPVWEPIYLHDPEMVKKDDQIRVAKPIDDLLSRVYFDEENPRNLKNHVMSGLVTPLPRLGNLRYPKLDLEGIEDGNVQVVESEPSDPKVQPKGPPEVIMPKGGPKGNPKGGPNKVELGGAEGIVESQKWDKANLPKYLEGRFLGNYHAFEPFDARDEKGTNPKGLPGQPPVQPPIDLNKDKIVEMPKDKKDFKDGFPGQPAAGQVHDQLVRFIDAGVEPGKTYVYSVVIRMENPNFGKKDLVSSGGLAEKKELTSNFAYSPPITIPGEYVFFAVDQSPEITPDMKVKPLPPPPDQGAPRVVNNHAMQTTIQIHKWVGDVHSENSTFPYQVSDWAIAERVLVARGEYIGRPKMLVEMPVWRDRINGFEIGTEGGKIKGKITKPGLNLNFQASPPYMLIDFEGGKQKQMVPADKGNLISDDSALEILVLAPDGKLLVRNSRDDSDPDHAEGRERIFRLNNYRDRLRQLRNAPNPGGGGVGMPGKGN